MIQCLSYLLFFAARSYPKCFTLLQGKPKSKQTQQFTVKLNFCFLNCLISAQDRPCGSLQRISLHIIYKCSYYVRSFKFLWINYI